MSNAAPNVTIEGDRQTDRNSVGLHRVGPVSGRLHMSCQQLGDHRVSLAGPPLACLLACVLALTAGLFALSEIVKNLRPKSQTVFNLSQCEYPSIGSTVHLFDFKSHLSDLGRSPSLHYVTLWPLDPVVRAALWPQELRNHMLSEIISCSGLMFP
jgi:hypothetical protein